MSIVDIALQIASKAHEGQVDRDGEAYILHPLTVGLMGKTDDFCMMSLKTLTGPRKCFSRQAFRKM